MIYIIDKGYHSFSPKKFKLFIGNKISKKVLFYKDCQYEIPGHQLNINKLFGFSRGYHHYNSVRFGWRYMDGKIEILAYMYKKGKRINEWDEDIHLAFIELDKPYNFILMHKKDTIHFIIKSDNNDLLTIRTFSFNPLFKLGYILNPYFGGSEPSPKTMKISITDI
jgi:hypothetical protein